MKKIIGLSLLVILAGCAGNRTDSKLPSDKCMQLSPYLAAEAQTIHMEHLSIELSPRYDEEKGVIEAKGRITLNHNKIPVSARIYNFSMKVYLLDKEYRILKKISIRDTSVKSAKNGLPLELSFAYKNEYSYISFDYYFDFNYDLA